MLNQPKNDSSVKLIILVIVILCLLIIGLKWLTNYLAEQKYTNQIYQPSTVIFHK